ncbi:MAG TPA: GvpL/GvpF family gas vesicle protein [Myxococcales bacterium]|nr:GvpL/GvpF family gas vesicle protein [Myxococcales bacterium]
MIAAGAELGHSCLYAVVPAAEAPALLGGVRGVRDVSCGPVAMLVGHRSACAEQRAALQHDRVVGRALQACSSVVPLRFGMDVRSEAELYEVLEANLDLLSRHLARFRGRVEMGLKVRLASLPAPGRYPPELVPVRALAPGPEDRLERLVRSATGYVFEGSYLIRRQDVAAYWAAVDQVRDSLPAAPVLGSGPWAAYSFCDFALRQGPGGRREGSV